jgi:hypothetical protein
MKDIISNSEDVTSSLLTTLAKGAGYIGSVCLLIGGLSTMVNLPFIGQIGYLNGPTGSGFVYMLLAGISIYITYSGRLFLLYLTGGLAGIMAAYDILKGTRLGYIVQMVLGGGLTGGAGGTQDPIVTGMMQDAGFSIPAGWIALGIGILLLLITPNLSVPKKEEKGVVQQTRDTILQTRMKELDNLILMYERGHISKEEFHQLKKEIMGKK